MTERSTEQWQEIKRQQGGAFTPEQRKELVGERDGGADDQRDAELVRRYHAGEWLSKTDRREASRLVKEREALK